MNMHQLLKISELREIILQILEFVTSCKEPNNVKENVILQNLCLCLVMYKNLHFIKLEA